MNPNSIGTEHIDNALVVDYIDASEEDIGSIEALLSAKVNAPHNICTLAARASEKTESKTHPNGKESKLDS